MTRDWADKDGQRRSQVEVVADEMLMLGNRGSAQSTEEDTGDREAEEESA